MTAIRSAVALLFVFTMVVLAQEQPARNLMPVPLAVQFHTGRLKIDGNFRIAVAGYSDSRLERAADRAMRRLERRTGLEFARGLGQEASQATVVIQCKAAGEAAQSIDEDESYSLEVNQSQATLTASTVVGALRGLETLLQLIEADRAGYFLPAVSIQDRPRFAWRGLLIDVARHFQPVEVLRRNLDAMAAVKMNVLHLHLTDDQGFRIESRKYPKLHQMGSGGQYYTQEQMREIVQYARERGIRVVPEFEMPGHAMSWFVGYPELASAPGPYDVQRKFRVFDAPMDPTREGTYQLVDGFLGEMARLFPDPYVHIGGDENEGKQWLANPKIQAFMQKKGFKDPAALQAYFNQRLVRILQKHGKTMVGWDEILTPELPQDVVVQSWHGVESLREGAEQGHNMLMSAPYYLDHLDPAAQHYLADPLEGAADWSPNLASRVLGGEACMWGEHITPETIDSRAWPRAAAIAERLWSPREVNDVPDMYRRLAAISIELEDFGLTHEIPEPMLRRLAHSGEIAPLRAFLDVVEPVRFPDRLTLQAPTQLTPMTRLVDAARPDPPARRRLAALVDAIISDPQLASQASPLARTFAEWRNLRPELQRMMDSSPVLQEAEPRVQELSELGSAGLEAMSFLTSSAAPPAEWKQSRLALLDDAEKPKALVRFVFLPSLRKLILAASNPGASGNRVTTEK